MADIVSAQKRSEMMAGIRGKNTKPENLIRKALHARGYRYRLHVNSLPGKPDLVLAKYNAVIFVHGCFWHLHGCHLFKWPQSRQDFWQKKIFGNKMNDKKVVSLLRNQGWRVLIVWECATKGRTRWQPNEIADDITAWLESGQNYKEISGNNCKI